MELSVVCLPSHLLFTSHFCCCYCIYIDAPASVRTSDGIDEPIVASNASTALDEVDELSDDDEARELARTERMFADGRAATVCMQRVKNNNVKCSISNNSVKTNYHYISDMLI